VVENIDRHRRASEQIGILEAHTGVVARGIKVGTVRRDAGAGEFMSTCQHTPACPSCDASDASAARIVSEHLQDCGYALLCNGVIILEGDGALVSSQRNAHREKAGSRA
jgi:hypothetical protein